MTDYYDNTRISTYRRCGREYYFRMVRHWRPDGIALPLTFGLAWHEAMDVIWGLAASDKSDEKLREMAHTAFMETWIDQGLPPELSMDQEEALTPRTPGVALSMIANYIKERRSRLRGFSIIDIERPFAVPIYATRDDIFYVGRRDKVFALQDKSIIIGEHKTTSLYAKKGGFRQEFMDSFSPNSQIDGYLHSGHMEYGNRVAGVWIDAALVHKNVHDAFKFIPIDRSISLLDAWLVETRRWIDRIQGDMWVLNDPVRSQSVMAAFPKNTDSCYRYNKACPYIDLCRAKSNPNEITETPEGFVEDPWSPFDVLELEKIGFEG